MLKLIKFLFIYLCFTAVASLFCVERLAIPRTDQSQIEVYITYPEGEGLFPIMLLMQGSDAESVLNSHNTLSDRFNPYGIAILSIEKRGINCQGKDNQQFIEHDYFESRLQDFATVMQSLEHQSIPKWNGDLILIAGSEGGKIAPRLALNYPSHVAGVILIGSGGGLPFSEELKFQIEFALSNMNPFYKFCFKIRDIIWSRTIDDQYVNILEHSDSLELWYQKTFRWWASYLNYNPLPEMLQLDIPIYMVHGELDNKIPVESADVVKAAFEEVDKFNLTYARYVDLGHSLKGRDDVYHRMTEWILRVFNLTGRG